MYMYIHIHKKLFQKKNFEAIHAFLVGKSYSSEYLKQMFHQALALAQEQE